MPTVSEPRAEMTLTRVAAWLGDWYYGSGPCPTGVEAAHHALGPMLVMDWEPRPDDGDPAITALLLEGVTDWADYAAAQLGDELRELLNVHTEVWGGYALLLYPFNRTET